MIKIKKPRILIIDDEPENLNVLVTLLQPHYQVLAANSATNALNIVNKLSPPDLILLDVMMPDMDGYTLLKHLKQLPNTKNIPVIFVTALTEDTDEQTGLEMGAVDFICKPIRSTIVLLRIAIQLELKEARDILTDHNARLESEIQRRTFENSLIQEVTLNALAELAETRDTDTGHHIHRTQSYVEILARQMSRHPKYSSQLNEAQQKLIVKAAPLHDIGKVGIPDKILLKPGALSKEEYELMKKHTNIGANTISNAIDKALAFYERSEKELTSTSLLFLNTARDIALYHHECWDGNGYPEKLMAEDIPLPARLMAIADVYDAMTTQRVYKSALPHDVTVQEIKNNSGSQFDPDIVEAFLASQEEFIKIRLSLSES